MLNYLRHGKLVINKDLAEEGESEGAGQAVRALQPPERSPAPSPAHSLSFGEGSSGPGFTSLQGSWLTQPGGHIPPGVGHPGSAPLRGSLVTPSAFCLCLQMPAVLRLPAWSRVSSGPRSRPILLVELHPLPPSFWPVLLLRPTCLHLFLQHLLSAYTCVLCVLFVHGPWVHCGAETQHLFDLVEISYFSLS